MLSIFIVSPDVCGVSQTGSAIIKIGWNHERFKIFGPVSQYSSHSVVMKRLKGKTKSVPSSWRWLKLSLFHQKLQNGGVSWECCEFFSCVNCEWIIEEWVCWRRNGIVAVDSDVTRDFWLDPGLIVAVVLKCWRWTDRDFWKLYAHRISQCEAYEIVPG